MSKTPLLEVSDLSIDYETMDGAVHAVRNVSLTVAQGEVVGLVGETGCGKSTLGYALLGDLGDGGKSSSGRVLFKGRDLLAMDAAELRCLRGAEIAMVHQSPAEALSPSMKVGSQLIEVLKVHRGLTRTAARQRVLELLDRVHLPDPAQIMERYPHELSGGQQQRVVIAAALLGDPDLLVLDEPTTGLDVTVEATVLDLLLEIKAATGVAMVYIAHNLGVIARICDRVGVMYAGELVELADVQALFHKPLHPYTRNLLSCVPRVDRQTRRGGLRSIPGTLASPYAELKGCAFADRCSFVVDECHLRHPELSHQNGQRKVRCFRWEEVAGAPGPRPATVESGKTQDPIPAAEVLSIEGVHVDYVVAPLRLGGRRRTLHAVEDVNLRIRTGGITAIVGESGCGKSSLAKAVVGLQPVSTGRLWFDGIDITRSVKKRPSIIHRLLQMVFQDQSATLNPSISIGHIVGRPLTLFNTVPRQEIRSEVQRLLNAVGLDSSSARRKPAQLSGGQRQRVAIARAFSGHPRLVVCDEITSALDVSVQASVLNFLLQLQQGEGTSLVFISHDLGVVRYIADEVVVMYLGRICEAGPADSVFEGPNHPYTEALLSAVPLPDPSAPRQQIRLEGPVPSALAKPGGCPFHTRCPRKIGHICETETPPVRDRGDGHRIRCHLEYDGMPKRKPEVGNCISSIRGRTQRASKEQGVS